MAIKMSVTVRNARLDAIETAINTGAILKLRTGAPPTNIADADSGTVVASLTLPTDWMNAAATGSKTKLGTWEDLTADADGTVGHFRIYASNGTTQHMQGTVTSVAVGTGDMLLDNPAVVTGQAVTITTFTLTDGNA